MMHRHTIAICAALAVAAGLTGCTATSPSLRVAEGVYRSTIGGGEKVTPQQVAAIPAATIGVQKGRGDQALFVLDDETGDALGWTGGRHYVLYTRHGRVTSTGGFAYNLSHLAIVMPGPITGSDDMAPKPGDHYELRMDFGDLGIFGLIANCTASDAGPETIEVLGTPLHTQHIEEDCDTGEAGWSFENEFWTDPASGYIWRSVQHVNPKLPALTIEAFRPPG